jgi:hypothetical protein
MKKIYCLGLLALLLLALTGCGGGDDHDPQPVFGADILSDQPADGDIAYDPVNQVYTISTGPPTLFFGIDELVVNLPEYRAFLDFPLNGATGAAVVPLDARILSATLEVFVNEVSFAPVVPALIDLVIYSLSGLQAGDFDSPALLTQEVNFFPEDQGKIVAINITPLMQEAQRLGLPDLQLRLLLDLAVDRGFVGLDDRPTVSLTAPLLKVDYVF